MKKKLIAALTSAAMVATMVPATAFAASPDTAKSEQPAAVAAATETEEDANVKAFRDAVAAIPTSGDDYGYTDAYKKALDAADVAFGKLTVDQQATFSKAGEEDPDYTKLKEAKTNYSEWETEVKDAIAAIEELPSKVSLTAKDGATAYDALYVKDGILEDALTAYADLDMPGQTGKVTNANTLKLLASNATGNLVETTDATTIQESVMYKALAAMANVKDTGVNGSNYDTAFDVVKAAVDALSSGQISMIESSDFSSYQTKIRTVQNAKDLVDAFDDAAKAITDKNYTTITSENVQEAEKLCAAAEAAYKALDAVTGLQATKTSPYATNVQALRTKITKFQSDETAAAEAKPVLEQIKALPKASAIDDMSYFDQIYAIYDAYKALSEEAQDVVENDDLATDYNAVADKIATVYSSMTAEDQAARVVAAMAKLPSNDYATNLVAQREYKMATTSDINAPNIGRTGTAYTGKVDSDAQTKYFLANEKDKYDSSVAGMDAAYKKEVQNIIDMIGTLDSTKIPNMTASDFATAKNTIERVVSAVDALSEGAVAYYDGTSTTKLWMPNPPAATSGDVTVEDYVELLKTAKDARIGADTEADLEARMKALVNITSENLSTQKPIVEALRADYDAYAENVTKGVYGSDYTGNPFSTTKTAIYAYLTTAESQIAALEVGKDAAKVDEAIAALKPLDATKTYTVDELLNAKSAIESATKAYDALSPEEVAKVTKYADLLEATTALDDAISNTINTAAKAIGEVGLKLTDTQIEQFQVVSSMLAALEKTAANIEGEGKTYFDAAATQLKTTYPNVGKVEALLEGNLTTAANVAAAREAYDALSDIEKALVDTAKLQNLVNAEKGTLAGKLIYKATVSAIEDQTYTGDAIKPEFKVTAADDAKTVLKEGTDYTVEYDNNVRVGTATITITGKGDYAGTQKVSFNILGISIDDATVASIATQTYTGSQIKPEPSIKVDGKTLVKGEDYTVSYGANVNVGTGTITITGIGTYTGTKTVSFTINKASINGASVSGIANRYYTGKARTQTDLKVTMAGKALSKTDYKVAYKNNKNVGKATLTITGQGNYTGTITKTFIVKPRKVANVKVTKGKKRVTVRYKKQNGARYQIYYKTTGSKAKTVKTAAVKRTIKKLKSGKTYTIKVRAYKKIGSKTYYGKYSKAKKVRVR